MLFQEGDIVTLARLTDPHYIATIKEWSTYTITVQVVYKSSTGDFTTTEFFQIPRMETHPTIQKLLDTQFEILSMYRTNSDPIEFLDKVSTYRTPANYFTARAIPINTKTHPIFFLPLKYLEICV